MEKHKEIIKITIIYPISTSMKHYKSYLLLLSIFSFLFATSWCNRQEFSNHTQSYSNPCKQLIVDTLSQENIVMLSNYDSIIQQQDSFDEDNLIWYYFSFHNNSDRYSVYLMENYSNKVVPVYPFYIAKNDWTISIYDFETQKDIIISTSKYKKAFKEYCDDNVFITEAPKVNNAIDMIDSIVEQMWLPKDSISKNSFQRYNKNSDLIALEWPSVSIKWIASPGYIHDILFSEYLWRDFSWENSFSDPDQSAFGYIKDNIICFFQQEIDKNSVEEEILEQYYLDWVDYTNSILHNINICCTNF